MPAYDYSRAVCVIFRTLSGVGCAGCSGAPALSSVPLSVLPICCSRSPMFFGY